VDVTPQLLVLSDSVKEEGIFVGVNATIFLGEGAYTLIYSSCILLLYCLAFLLRFESITRYLWVNLRRHRRLVTENGMLRLQGTQRRLRIRLLRT